MDFDQELHHPDPFETSEDEAPPPAGDDADDANEAEGASEDPGDDADRPRRRRRRFKSPRASAAHLQRIEDYRNLVETRGWIFAPPSPPLPLSALLTHLTGKQLESLAKTG